MDPAQFLSASRVLIVAGKGGVGKTTVSAVLGRAASRAGLRTLIVEIEGTTAIPRIFNRPQLGYEELILAEGSADGVTAELRARLLSADDALVDYLHGQGLARISNRLVGSGALDMVATATPGIRDVLILGKVKQLERSGDYDLVIVDGQAAGHAITFLRSAHGLLDAVSVGPINAQARDVAELLTDPKRCQVVLVTLPEETPVNELVETAFRLEDEIGVQLGPVVVNGITPPIAGLELDVAEGASRGGIELTPTELTALQSAATFRASRQHLEARQLDRLAELLPLPQVRLPQLPTAAMDLEHLDELVTHLLGGHTGGDR